MLRSVREDGEVIYSIPRPDTESVLNRHCSKSESTGIVTYLLFMDARSASVHVIFCPFFIFFMGALVGQTAERIFTKLSHVVDIRHHL